MGMGEIIVQLRKKSAMSQSDLAELLNVSRQSVSKWELNQTEPDSGKLMNMANVFNVGVETFYVGLAEECNYNSKKGRNIHIFQKILFYYGLIGGLVSIFISFALPHEIIINDKVYGGLSAYIFSEKEYLFKVLFFSSIPSLVLSFLLPIITSKFKEEKKG